MKIKEFRKILRKLELKFTVNESVTDHYRYDLILDGKLVLWLNRSHSFKDGHARLIGKNLKININQLNKFIQCTLSIDDYISLLKEKKVI